MLKTLLVSLRSQLDKIADRVDDEIVDKTSSSSELNKTLFMSRKTSGNNKAMEKPKEFPKSQN